MERNLFIENIRLVDYPVLGIKISTATVARRNRFLLGLGEVVTQRTLTPSFTGSNPVASAIKTFIKGGCGVQISRETGFPVVVCSVKNLRSIHLLKIRKD